jgi:transcriptional regulator with XRE-family HTH domain
MDSDHLTDALRGARARRRLPPAPARRLIRVEAAVSAATLARELGVSEMTVSRWERDDGDTPSPERAEAYLDALTRMAASLVVDA